MKHTHVNTFLINIPVYGNCLKKKKMKHIMRRALETPHTLANWVRMSGESDAGTHPLNTVAHHKLKQR